MMVIVQVGLKNRGSLTFQYVTEYKLSFTQIPGETNIWVTGNDGNPLIFAEITREDRLVINNLPALVTAKAVRLWPVAYRSWPCLRWELFGCSIGP